MRSGSQRSSLAQAWKNCQSSGVLTLVLTCQLCPLALRRQPERSQPGCQGRQGRGAARHPPLAPLGKAGPM